MTYKLQIINQIDSFYSQSSNLMKQQKQLQALTEEISNISKKFLTNDKIMYINS